MFRLITAVCFLLGGALAQTLPSFSPSTQQNLSVEYSNKFFIAGQLFKTSDVAQQPSVGTDSPLNGTYALLMMDPDAYYEGKSTVVLHWLQTDLRVASIASSSDGVYPLSSTVNTSTSTLAPYLSPAPPLQVPAVYHHYTFLLFNQTNQNLTISSSLNISLTYRVGFNLTDFVATSGLGPLVAATYFELVNTTSTSNSNSSFSNGTNTSSGSAPLSTGGSPSVMGAGVEYLGWPAALFALSFAV